MFEPRAAIPVEYPILAFIERVADEMFRKAGIVNLPAAAKPSVYGEALLVLVAGTPPIGFIRVIELNGQPHLEQLSVHPDYGRKGVGTSLLAAAIKQLGDRGYSALTLMTFEDVPWNAPFYRKRGFRTVAEVTPTIRWLLKRERELGMDKLGRRVALVYDLQAEQAG